MKLSSKNKLYAVAYALAIVASYQFSPAIQTELSEPFVSKAYAASAPIDIWWPVDMGVMTGTSPVKALVSDKNIEEYHMSWKVDDGNEVPMYTSHTDWPHKEAAVNFSEWKWKGSGPYNLTIVARDGNGSLLGSRTIRVTTGNTETNIPPSAPQIQPVTVSNPNIIEIASPVAVSSPQLAPAASAVPMPVATTPSAENVPPAASTAGTEVNPDAIEIWWPTAHTVVNATTPLKGLLKDQNVDNYKMFYQVDNGARFEMPTNWTDWPHKETVLRFDAIETAVITHTIIFTAVNLQGNTVASKRIPIRVEPTAVQAPTMGTATTNPLAHTQLFIGNNKNILNQMSYSSGEEKNLLQKFLNKPEAFWVGNWNNDVEDDVRKYVADASFSGTVPTLVAYNIPHRDCGSYSAGGASTADAYKTWIQKVTKGIGNNKVIIILEPDAVPSMDCLSENDQNTRLSLLSFAVTALKANNKTVVYIDAGNARWKSAEETAERLRKAGVASADGFSLNVSNFYTVEENASFGNKVSSLVHNKHYVIDTSRNGNGSNGEWCNPWGRALGPSPTTSTGHSLIDAYLWVKKPGESDGTCNTGPQAGTWWGAYALDLARNTR